MKLSMNEHGDYDIMGGCADDGVPRMQEDLDVKSRAKYGFRHITVRSRAPQETAGFN